ncbi:unnamed protein product [Linum tenue]|uniref:Transposase n=1 Tax=Linum tenue TaxID=586396 RepID=A0AAV0LLN0_9ROSI|nr:unnamed protein product [Linum tenue]
MGPLLELIFGIDRIKWFHPRKDLKMGQLVIAMVLGITPDGEMHWGFISRP